MAAILMYHHICAPPSRGQHRGLFVAPDRFASQMEYLKRRRFHVATLDEIRDDLLAGNRLPRRSVAITFDDGGADNYINALPVLRRHHFPATVFLVAGKPGQRRDKPHWPDEASRYLNPDEISEMASSGIAFGSHTLTHARLAELDRDQCEFELCESKRILEQLLGRPVGWLSFPFGSFSRQVVELTKNAGYLGAASTIRDNRVTPERLFCLPRIMVMPDATDRHFAYYFTPLYHWVHWWKNRRRWAKDGRLCSA